MEPRREAGPAAMGHPPWGSSMGFTMCRDRKLAEGVVECRAADTVGVNGADEHTPLLPRTYYW